MHSAKFATLAINGIKQAILGIFPLIHILYMSMLELHYPKSVHQNAIMKLIVGNLVINV